ncbi:MAG: alpha/beta hydrolase, partial [Bryobacteraceae bacterium]
SMRLLSVLVTCAVLFISAARAQDITVTRDIVYASNGGVPLHLDLYKPSGKKMVTGIVVVRGGGWRQGDKEGFSKIATSLAKQGFAAACIEYRVLPEWKFPTQVHDVKAAVRWMRAQGAQYRVRREPIGAIGGSAGGHLVAMLGTSFRAADLEGDGGNANVSSRVQAVVAMAPVVDFTSLGKAQPDRNVEFIGGTYQNNEAVALRASPVTYLSRDSAPMLLMHSTADKLVPYAQSLEMMERGKAVGVKTELVTIEDAPHGFWNNPRWHDEVMARAGAFFHRMLD